MTYSAVALGNFDGVHKAHAKLIKKTVASAKNNNLKSIVYTFEEHPSKILFGKSVKQIMTNGQKSEIIKKLGADEVFFEKTAPEVLGLSAEDFFVNILCKRFNAKFVAAGFNYTFGKGAGSFAQTRGKVRHRGLYNAGRKIRRRKYKQQCGARSSFKRRYQNRQRAFGT